MMTREDLIYEQVKKMGGCRLIDDKGNARALARLFFTPQGIEFCTENQFPTVEILQQFDEKELLENHFFVNSLVRIRNPHRVAFFGSKTDAEVLFDDAASCLHTVVVMKDARLELRMENHAVVKLYNVGGEVEIIRSDNSILL